MALFRRRKKVDNGDSALGPVFRKPSEKKDLGPVFAKPGEKAGPSAVVPTAPTKSRGGGGVSRAVREAAESRARAEADARARSEADAKAKEEKERVEAEQKRVQEEARRKAQELRLAELKKEIDRRRLIREEQARIEAERSRILREGGRTKSTRLRDVKTGAEILTTTTSIDKLEKGRIIRGRIITRENLKTGEVSTQRFEIDPKTKKLRRSGGISEKRATKEELQEIKDSLPPGDKLLVNPKTGQPLGIQSKILKQTIPWTEKGLIFYNEQISKRPELVNIFSKIKLEKLPKKEIKEITIKDKTKEEEKKLIKDTIKGFFTKIKEFDKKMQDSPFSRSGYIATIEKSSYENYIKNGGRKNQTEFFKQYRDPYGTKKLPEKERIIMENTYKSFGDEIINEPKKFGTTQRINFLTTLMSIGAPISAGLYGGLYKGSFEAIKTPTEKDLGADWKSVSKTVAKEFGKGAVEAFVIGKMISKGGKLAVVLTKQIGKGWTSIGFKGTSKLSPRIASKLRKLLELGFNVLGARYISDIGARGGSVIKNLRFKNYKTASVEASRILGELVGFYGESAIRKSLRKVMLKEDPRLLITPGTKAKPFAIEARDITVKRLNEAQKLLKKGEKLEVKFAKATPVKEPKRKKIVTPEKRISRGVKIDVPTPSGYATYAIGKDVYLIPRTFLRLRPGNTPKTYYKKWIETVKKKGLLPTFKELGLPRRYSPTIYKGSGNYLPRRRNEGLKNYYSRAQNIANKENVVQVVIAPKTVLKSPQPELEIKTIYPNPKGIKADVTRVKVGKDGFGHNVYVEIVAPKSIMQRIKFKIKEKIKFKVEAFKYLTGAESKVAKQLIPRILQNYNFIYKSKLKGATEARKHMLQVEKNFRKLLKEYKIKASENEIKAVSRLHDILKLRSLRIKDEPIIRKALLNGGLNKIPLVNKLTPKELKRVANAIGYHQDVNPNTLKSLKLNKFTKAFINADRLDITRYGVKVKPEKLFDVGGKELIPKSIRGEFKILNKKKLLKKDFTLKYKLRYSALLKKYPGLRSKGFENKLISKNKKIFEKLPSKQKKKLKSQEKEYKDYKESLREYKSQKVKKVGINYKTSKYESYNTKPYKISYKAGYIEGYESIGKAPTNYKANYKGIQNPYSQGYKDAYKGNYKINYRTGKYFKVIPKITKAKEKPTRLIFHPIKQTKTLSKPVNVYYVIAKKKGKLIKLRDSPLTLTDAKNYLAYRLDNELRRSGSLIKIGKSKKVIKLPPKYTGYFAKISKKLRPYKIVRGKKKMLEISYIEKKKFIGDRPSELAELARERAKAPKKKISKFKKLIKKKSIKRPTIKKSFKKKIVKKTTKTLKKKKIIKRVVKKTIGKIKSKKKTQIKKRSLKKPIKPTKKRLLKKKSKKKT